MKKIISILAIFIALSACSAKKSIITKQLNSNLSSSFYKNQFTGVLVIDAKTKDTIYNQDSHKYFIPASNTKIFTLFAALKTLPRKAPTLRYININDTLYFEGTGDPSFLHPYLKDSTSLHFLKYQSNLTFVSGNFQDEKYGAGWAWDDYQWYYSPERNALPINGNVVVSYKNTELVVSPPYFKDSVIEILHKDNRNEFSYKSTNLNFYFRASIGQKNFNSCNHAYREQRNLIRY